MDIASAQRPVSRPRVQTNFYNRAVRFLTRILVALLQAALHRLAAMTLGGNDMNRLDTYERSILAERAPSWLEIAWAWGLALLVVVALAPQPVKQMGLYPLAATQAVFHTGLSEPMGLAGIDQRAGVSAR